MTWVESAMSDLDENPEQDDALVTDEERREALERLERARVIESGTGEDVQDLMVRAYVHSGGVPSRIVSAGELGAALPDLTATPEGQRALERADEYVRVEMAKLHVQAQPDPPGRRNGDSDDDGDSGAGEP